MIVKIEGLTSEDDALLAVAMGADFVGFVFAPSPRQIAWQQAADIVKRLPHEVVAVGVFRDELPQRVVQIAQRSGMGAVQLHGNETPEQTRWIRERVPRVIKAFPAGDARVARIADWGADALLLDAAEPGSGRVFDWELASQVPEGQRLMVAGGLTPDNVAEVVTALRPWGVDVASGVERAPGQKDPVKLRAFVAAARRAAAQVAAAGPAPARGAPAPVGATDITHVRPPARALYDWEEDR